MSLRNFCRISLLLVVILSPVLGMNVAVASALHSLEEIRADVDRYLQNQFPSTPEQRIEITVNPLDSRLRFIKCDKFLTLTLRDNGQPGGQVSVKVQCNGSTQWGLFVSATIKQEIDVVIASRNLLRGTVLEASDLSMDKALLSDLPTDYVLDVNQLLGKELVRTLGSGNHLRLAHVTDPDIVERGDAVVIEAQIGQASVLSSGIALMNGKKGTQIRVRNDRSKRIITAEVVAPGRVRPAL